MKPILATIIITLIPTLATATGCDGRHLKDSANQCHVGQVVDPKTGNCVPQVSG